MKISYIVAIYNVDQFLERCLDSICNQTYKKIEIILVDDGSTDNSGVICDNYATRDERIKVIHQENKGVSQARNSGINTSTGEWICFIDGDDWIDIELGENLTRFIDNKCNYDMVFFQFKLSTENKNCNKYSGEQKAIELSKTDIEGLREGLLNPDIDIVNNYRKMNYNYQAPWGKLYRRKFLKENNLAFKKGVNRGQDLLFNFSVYKVLQYAVLIPVMGYVYRIRPSSIGHRYNTDIFKININLVNAIKESITDSDSVAIKEYYDLMVVRQFIYSIMLDCFHNENKASYLERRKKFLYYRNHLIFDESFKRADLKNFKFKAYLISKMSKYKFFLLIELVIKATNLIEK